MVRQMRRAAVLALAIVACPEGQVGHELGTSGGSAGASGGPGGATGSASAAGSTSGEQSSFPSDAGGDGGAGTGSADEGAKGEPPDLRFAVIGDYGLDGDNEAAVATLVLGWDPALVFTVGDNNYYSGEASTIDVNIGKYYQSLISPYKGVFGPGGAENKLFPSPGNHDWGAGDLDPYLDYFTLPGNERYYRLRRGPCEFFMIDSDDHEPDGNAATSVQAQWLEAALADSDAPFKVVMMHHPPYSSGIHHGSVGMRWPYGEWGADLVVAGHDHDYERLVVDDVTYLVAGTGGASLRAFDVEEVGTQRGHADAFGALQGRVNANELTVEFIATSGGIVDRVTLLAARPTSWEPLIAAGATWRFRESDPGPGWKALEYDAAWPAGPSPLGFGAGGEATTIPGGAMLDRPITTYFRHRFKASAADVGAPLRLRLAVDDGAVVHLNGVEVYRIDVPAGPAYDSTTAVVPVGDWFADHWTETAIPGAALREGDNVLAIEVHQIAVVSSDLRLDVELASGRF